jgi:hypothetical protein
MFIPNAPERSYWECEWLFPKTASVISIALPGSEYGPSALARCFYLELPRRFDRALAAARPRLQEAFRDWLKQEMPEDMFAVVKLAGFNVEDPEVEPNRVVDQLRNHCSDMAWHNDSVHWGGAAISHSGHLMAITKDAPRSSVEGIPPKSEQVAPKRHSGTPSNH